MQSDKKSCPFVGCCQAERKIRVRKVWGLYNESFVGACNESLFSQDDKSRLVKVSGRGGERAGIGDSGRCAGPKLNGRFMIIDLDYEI